MKLCGYEVGLDRPFFLIAGPCVVESEQLQMDVAGALKETTAALGIPFIFKSSYDKANRSSGTSFRGPGMERGLQILAEVKRQIGVPVLTDVHTQDEIPAVASVVDVLQTPAFLCRQTDFIQAVARSGKPVNIKKGGSGALRRQAPPQTRLLLLGLLGRSCSRGSSSGRGGGSGSLLNHGQFGFGRAAWHGDGRHDRILVPVQNRLDALRQIELLDVHRMTNGDVLHIHLDKLRQIGRQADDIEFVQHMAHPILLRIGFCCPPTVPV